MNPATAPTTSSTDRQGHGRPAAAVASARPAPGGRPSAAASDGLLPGWVSSASTGSQRVGQVPTPRRRRATRAGRSRRPGRRATAPRGRPRAPVVRRPRRPSGTVARASTAAAGAPGWRRPTASRGRTAARPLSMQEGQRGQGELVGPGVEVLPLRLLRARRTTACRRSSSAATRRRAPCRARGRRPSPGPRAVVLGVDGAEQHVGRLHVAVEHAALVEGVRALRRPAGSPRPPGRRSARRPPAGRPASPGRRTTSPGRAGRRRASPASYTETTCGDSTLRR